MIVESKRKALDDRTRAAYGVACLDSSRCSSKRRESRWAAVWLEQGFAKLSGFHKFCAFVPQELFDICSQSNEREQMNLCAIFRTSNLVGADLDIPRCCGKIHD